MPRLVPVDDLVGGLPAPQPDLPVLPAFSLLLMILLLLLLLLLLTADGSPAGVDGVYFLLLLLAAAATASGSAAAAAAAVLSDPEGEAADPAGDDPVPVADERERDRPLVGGDAPAADAVLAQRRGAQGATTELAGKLKRKKKK